MYLDNEDLDIKYKDLYFLNDYSTIYQNGIFYKLVETMAEILGTTITIDYLTGMTFQDFILEFNKKYRNSFFNEQFIEMLKYECVGNDDYTLNDFYKLLFKCYEGIDYNYPNNYFHPISKLNDVSINILKSVIRKCSANWIAKRNAYNTEYNPLENYSMEENEEINTLITDTNEYNQYTFNTQNDPRPIGKDTRTSEGSKDDNTRKLTRSGNIGVTTSQQMLESELKLRNYNLAYDIMRDFADAFFKKNYV